MEIIRNLIHSDLALIKEFRDETLDFLKDSSYDDDVIFKIRLILDELITNSYKHGNQKNYEKMIDIIMLLDRDYCMIKVKDEGEGINYTKEGDMLADHGRGIKLVYNLADNLIVQDNTISAFLLLDK
ncbi:ATP-binding protein [Anaerococcus sp. ENR1011]|uniref:ATP-binding protein n=1 Tax=Anaerococcus groningensis TaxID=3115616 RepID=A0ABW9N1U8_9FIRM